MQQVQDEVNKWETRMNTASRMLTEKQQRVQQTKTTTHNTSGRGDNNPITCYRCSGQHKQNVCKIKREDVTCAKCSKQGHMM